jgi:hypothetical protein
VIPSFRDVIVTGRHERHSTTLDVVPEGAATPVARLHKEHFYTSRDPLRVYVGPDLDQLVGWVTHAEAMGVDRVKHGTVRHKESAQLSKQRWTFEQNGLQPLVGTPEGAGTKLRYGTPLAWVPGAGSLDTVFTYHIRFRGPDSEGFEFTRLKGLRPRYALRIHDARISSLLALSVVVHYDRFLDADPKKGLMDFWRVGGD